MSDAVLVALITGGMSVIGTVITVLVSNHRTVQAMDKRSEIADVEINAKLEKLQAVNTEKFAEIKTEFSRVEAKMDKHNQLMERTYRLEEKVAALERRPA